MISITQAHKGLVASKMHAVQARIVPEFAPPVVHLRLSNGLQKGLTRDIEQAELSIGSSFDDDVILLDEGIVDNHIRLSFGSSVFGDVVIGHAQADGAILGDEVLIAGQPSGAHQLPATLKIGSSLVDLRSKDAASESVLRSTARGIKKRWWLKWPLMILGAYIVFALPQEFSRQNELAVVDAGSIAQMTAAARDANGAAPAVLPQVAGANIDSASQQLEAWMAQSGLDAYLIVSGETDGSLHVYGSVPQNMMKTWRDAQVWYDAQELSPTLVQHVDVAPILTEFPSISAVKFGDKPELIFANGTRAKVGDTVQGSWIINEIDRNGIVLQRGSETIPLEF